MPLKDKIGFTEGRPALASPEEERRLREFVNLKLASRGFPIVGKESDYPFLELGRALIKNFQEKTRLLSGLPVPGRRIDRPVFARMPGRRSGGGDLRPERRCCPPGH
ncbi:MAG: hypothetical protein R3F11_12255 [Verrucomicrobiales bacterium]